MAFPATVESRRFAPTPPTDLAIVALDDGNVGVPEETHKALLFLNFPYFMSSMVDETGRPMIVAEHHEEWCGLMAACPLLVLMAPRDHGKSYTTIAYLCWRAYRHNRDPYTGELMEDLPEGRFEAVIFSEGLEQAKEFFGKFQSLMLANMHLFEDILPTFKAGRAAVMRGLWSRTRVRLRNRFELSIRAYRTSTRGLHPNLLILDDVLSEKNSMTAYQRGKVWNYFVSTLVPMNPEQIIVIGTALHYDDLLHRLQPDPSKPPIVIRRRKARFRWVKYKAIDWDTGTVLWPARHDRQALEGFRALDVIAFSREYQNDPRDDAASLFPFELTSKALNTGLQWEVTEFRKDPAEYTVLGHDMAQSEAVGADFTVTWVAAYNPTTGKRRLLAAWREKGLTFKQQVNLLRTVCAVYTIDMGVVEENGFQKWLYTEAQSYPETRGRLVGHRTGQEKASLEEGVPALKMSLLNDLWIIPAHDGPALDFARIWQSEASAFGWKDDKLQGVGEHDDTVMAWWFAEKGARLIDEMLRHGAQEAVVTAEEVGIPDRVKIGEDYG
jgi:hypothetical protein